MIQNKTRNKYSNREGIVIPMFALLAMILFAFCAFAINVAFMQLTNTELKIATDAASHAGGRALSLEQSTQAADRAARIVARRNSVAGNPLIIVPRNDVEFGTSVQASSSERYTYQPVSRGQARRGLVAVTSVNVNAAVDIPMAFRFLENTSSYTPSRNSIATQVDRDISMVIDRSGSMLAYKDEEQMREVLRDMRDQNYITSTEYEIATGQHQAFTHNGNQAFYRRGYFGLYYPRYRASGWVYMYQSREWVNGFDVIGAMEQFRNANAGDSRDIDAMLNFVKSWEGVDQFAGNRKGSWDANSWINSGMFNDNAPSESRWDYLYRGVEAFLDVLEETPQQEVVSLVVFSIGATTEVPLTTDYDAILEQIAEIIPTGGTAIHDGLDEGLEEVLRSTRPFAAKTIVAMTDGSNNDQSIDLGQLTADILGNKDVKVHTVTFTKGAEVTKHYDAAKDQYYYTGPMVNVASRGGGKHYHSDEADGLEKIFEEIANNLPTIWTQ